MSIPKSVNDLILEVDPTILVMGMSVTHNYSLPSINVNPREWIKVNIYRGVNN